MTYLTYSTKTFFTALCLSLALLTIASAQSEAVSYTEQAISLFQEHWERSDTVDWDDIRATYLAEAQTLQTAQDSYPLIRSLIVELGDSWSYLPVEGETERVPKDQTGFRVLMPDWVVVYVFEESPAEEAGLRVGDKIVSVDGTKLTQELAIDAPFQPNAGAIYSTCAYTPFAFCEPLRRVYTPNTQLEVYRQSEDKTFLVRIDGRVSDNLMQPTGKSLGDIGYLELTILKTSDDDYLDTVDEVIEQVNQTPTCGWIVDLRRHAGGEGPFSEALGNLREQSAEDTAVAVLMSPLTYSMGEATAQDSSLTEFKQVQLFGEVTGGFHPDMDGFRLSEEATLFITAASWSITPDVEVKNDWTRFQMDADPVVMAAQEWLSGQPACK